MSIQAGIGHLFKKASDRQILDHCSALPVPDPASGEMLKGILALKPDKEEQGLGRLLGAKDENGRTELDFETWTTLASNMYPFELNISQNGEKVNSSKTIKRFIIADKDNTLE